jgi:uncharacterized protein (TIGR03118 family)
MFMSQKFSLQTTPRLIFNAALMLVAIALISLPAAAQRTQPTILTSDIGGISAFTDANLVNPWGITASPASPWWVSDNATGLSTLYDGTGKPAALVVTIPGATGGNGNPTGTIFNSTSDFQVNGNATHFLFCSEDGSISGWSSGTSAVIAVNNSGSEAVYKGLTLGSANGSNYLYVANFHNGTVDVFDKNFSPFSFGAGAFTDNTLPAGYAPFNVANLGNGQLAVAYAQQDADKHDEVAGIGKGYITVYDMSGSLKFRLQHVLYDNAPWAMVVAPQGFGGFGGDILVGMFGSGAIAVYDPTGKFLGILFDPASLNLSINGLWGLGFGNGSSSGPKTTLYFAAGTFDEAHGTFGSIIALSGPVTTGQPQVNILKRW